MLWALPWNALCSALAYCHLPPLINKVPVKLSIPGHLRSVCKIIFPFSLYEPTWYLTNWTSISFSKSLALSYFLLWLTLFPVPGVSNFCPQECFHLFRPDFTSPSHNSPSGPLEPPHLHLCHDLLLYTAIHAFSLLKVSLPGTVPGVDARLEGIYQMN